MPDPTSAGVRVENNGAFSCWVYVKSGNHESVHSGLLNAGDSRTFYMPELAQNGFSIGEDCWMGVTVAGGSSGHESGDNFTLGADGGFQGVYRLTGGTLTPEWHRDF